MTSEPREEREPCPCQDGMFASAIGRRLLFGAGAAAAALAPLRGNAAEMPNVPPDPRLVPGRPTGADGGYGSRSPFETARRILGPVPNDLTTWTFTPLASQLGNITPSGLHYERHHSGIPSIDPSRHTLLVHGMVQTPKRFTMPDLARLPRITRKYFIECSGNTGGAYQKLPLKTVQISHGLLSTSEWTGVPFATLAEQVGISRDASWVLAEGADGARMTRSIPMEKMMKDAILAYGQNGEAIRPEQGYPLRLLLPGYEGNTHIKWLHRLQVSDKPFMSREDTSKYTDLMADGIARHRWRCHLAQGRSEQHTGTGLHGALHLSLAMGRQGRATAKPLH
jgi:sulfane dehydrogenase subunit SoxC